MSIRADIQMLQRVPDLGIYKFLDFLAYFCFRFVFEFIPLEYFGILAAKFKLQ